MNEKIILTFGYGNRTNYSDLSSVIEDYNVSFVVDIRKKPRGWSAIWNSSSLDNFCNSIGIQYISKVDLGNESGKSNWIPKDSGKAEVALEDISRLSEEHNILLLCAEKDWKRCHRTAVSVRLQDKTGHEILHIK